MLPDELWVPDWVGIPVGGASKGDSEEAGLAERRGGHLTKGRAWSASLAAGAYKRTRGQGSKL